jgi:hypothetical protein
MVRENQGMGQRPERSKTMKSFSNNGHMGSILRMAATEQETGGGNGPPRQGYDREEASVKALHRRLDGFGQLLNQSTEVNRAILEHLKSTAAPVREPVHHVPEMSAFERKQLEIAEAAMAESRAFQKQMLDAVSAKGTPTETAVKEAVKQAKRDFLDEVKETVIGDISFSNNFVKPFVETGAKALAVGVVVIGLGAGAQALGLYPTGG